MTLFWIGAVVLLAASIAALVWPLVRERSQRGVALAVAVAVALVSVLLYREWSNWDRTQAAEAAEQSAMVGRLARRLEKNPDDVEGWLTLGRSQLAIGQYPLAQRAFRRADRAFGEFSRAIEASGFLREGVLIVLDAVIQFHALWLIAIGIAATLLLRASFHRTSVGLSMMAASIDPDGAAMTGISVPRMRALTFVLGGAVGGLAGVLVAPLITIHYEMGLLLTLKGFAAAILGGLLWGVLALRNRSLLAGLGQHYLLGLALDAFICCG